MSLSQTTISTREFAQKAGVSTSTVSKWLRSGIIIGQKKKGKWLISSEELTKVQPVRGTRTSSATTPKTESISSRPKANGTVFTVEQFSTMTYLTEFGVKKWLKEGRLVGAVDDSGTLCVDAVNLDNPMIKRLVR